MKKSIQPIIALMIFVFCIASVSAAETLQGYVNDTNGNPINNTLVELYNQSAFLLNSTTTDEIGFYQMTYDITFSGVYILNFGKEGYINRSLNKLIFNNSATYEWNVILKQEDLPSGTITGTVSNANGTLENASVLIKVNDSIMASAKTNSAGIYSINLSPGTYSVSASYLSYMGQTKTAEIINGTTTTLDFALGTCSDRIKNQGETGVDCGGPCSACSTGNGETIVSSSGSSGGGGGGGGGGGCLPSWTCTEWSECSADGEQTRVCSDKWKCGTTYKKPAETQNCTYVPESAPETNETAEIEEEAKSAGIIGITGRAVTNILNFGKTNYAFVLILIGVVVLFVIISTKMSREEDKKRKEKKNSKKVEEEEEKVISIHHKIAKHARRIHKKVNHAVNHHVIRHVKNAHSAIKHNINKHFVERIKRAHRAAKLASRKHRKIRKRKPKIVERTTTKKTIRKY